MEGIVTFNVSGTRFQAAKDDFVKFPTTTLGMLLLHPKEEEYFIDRDPVMFRWILQWHRTGILEDHKTVGTSIETWDHELEYYGIFSKEIEAAGPALGEQTTIQREKRKRERESDFEQKCKEAHKRLELEEYRIQEERQNLFENMLLYMISHMKPEGSTQFTFAQSNDGSFPDAYPEDARFNIAVFLNNKADDHVSAFKSFCAKVGFDIEDSLKTDVSSKTYSNNSGTGRYKNQPAALAEFPSPNTYINLGITRKKKE